MKNNLNKTIEKPVDILMIGSSIFEFWGRPNWGNYLIANLAIRSTTTNDWLNFEMSQLPETKHILIYCGSNDLIFGFSDEQIYENLLQLMNKITTRFKTAKIGYFSIIKCPQKAAAKQLTRIEKINAWMRQHTEPDYCYFDFNSAIDNQTIWFIEDGLHLTDEAYQMLDQFFAPKVDYWVQSVDTAE